MKKFWHGLRSFLFITVLVISVPIWTLVMHLFFWLPHRGMFVLIRWWSAFVKLSARYIAGIRYEIIGCENIPQTACIYFVKHQSTWETLALLSILPIHVYVMKKELLRIPLFGSCLRLARCIAIDRSKGLKALKEVSSKGKSFLQNGISVLIFPEGTRVPVGSHPKFHKSGAMLAKSTGFPIVPIAHNTGLFWPKNSFIKTPGKVTIVIGNPIPTQGRTLEEISDEAYEWIKIQSENLEKI